jgi:hypothetical protein
MTNVMYNLILVIIDRLTKYRHFILYKEASKAIKLMYTFLKVVITNYGLLEEILLDRDKLFTLKF